METPLAQSYKKFLDGINNNGIVIDSLFEVEFSFLDSDDNTILCTQISTTALKLETQEINFEGRKVEIPMFPLYDHEFTFTFLNDNGLLYSKLKNYMITLHSIISRDNTYANPYSDDHITIYVLNNYYNNDKQKLYDHCIELNGVRIKEISSLQFNSSGNTVQTFNVTCSAINYQIINNK